MGGSTSQPALSDYTYLVPDSENAAAGLGAIHRNPTYKDHLHAYHYENSKTLYEAFQRGLGVSGHRPCMGYRAIGADGNAGPFTWMTYNEIWHKVLGVGAGMYHLDLNPVCDGELRLVGLFSKNRYEWVVVEQACNAYKSVVVPFYATLGEDSVGFVLRQTQMRTVFCSSEEMAVLIKAKAKGDLPNFTNIVQFEDVTNEKREELLKAGITLRSLTEVMDQGHAHPMPAIPPAPTDVATFCYTSGTTGDPKGAMLTHENVIADVAAANKAGVETTHEDRHLSYLPLAHMFERVVQVAIWQTGGSVGFFQGSPLKLLEDLAELHPTIFPSVPRLYNKIYDKITAGVTAKGGLAAKLFNNGLETKLANLRASSQLTHGFYDRLVFGKIATRLGLDQCRLMVTGSAPIAAHVMDFLRVVFSCTVIEGYGQTECGAAATVTPVSDQATSGHVGIPLACNEIRLVSVPEMDYLVTDRKHGDAEAAMACVGRGEVCYRGPNVFKGYYKAPDKTAEAIDADGWLHSGDVGLWTPQGYLKIIDRKKNIFKLSQGEYIAAEKIENVYTGSALVAQAFVYGDSMQSCLVAIIVPDADGVKNWAATANVAGDFEALCKDERLKEAIMVDLKAQAKTRKLNSFEQAKAIYVDSEPFSEANDLLTPTFKLKRPSAKRKYQSIIDGLYASLGEEGVVAGKAGVRQGQAEGSA